MASLYPAKIDDSATLPDVVDNTTPVQASVVSALRTAILNVERALGVNPASVYGTVRNRLDVIESILIPGEQGGSGLFKAGGDLAGNGNSQTVIGIQNVPVSSTAPSDGYLLTYDAAHLYWKPAPPPVSFTAGGDLAGTNSVQTVTGLYSHPLASTNPTQSSVPVWDGASYSIRQLSADDIAAGFTINSFTGGSTVEIGATVTNPSFTASYSHIPNSASITNTDGLDSPHALSTPFTSATITGSFHHTTQTSVTFTLTAIYTSTKTSTQSITYLPRSFGGVGAAGATSSVTASGNNATLSNGATVNSLGLHSSDVGQNYGPFSPSSQKIYLLLIGGSHTFKDQNGFSFAMNSPTAVSFTNQNGAVVSMFLYESTNLLSSSFTINVVS